MHDESGVAPGGFRQRRLKEFDQFLMRLPFNDIPRDRLLDGFEHAPLGYAGHCKGADLLARREPVEFFAAEQFFTEEKGQRLAWSDGEDGGDLGRLKLQPGVILPAGQIERGQVQHELALIQIAGNTKMPRNFC